MKNMNLKYPCLLFVLLILTATSGAMAQEDGGGRSVFARGTGERALALGGAYGALADDASALVWNPAGLARVQRKGLYAGHSSLIGLGFSEQTGLLALPNWRWGTVGLGMRRFGVDGIEGRDPRGTITEDNLKDTETEILLGYGRPLGEALDLGLTFKYRNHELSGDSDGAPGLDVGVLFRPLAALGLRSQSADRLRMGLSARNLIEPSIRLDEESVADPTGLRAGLTYGGDLGSGMGWVLAADVEKTREMSTHLHLGAETTLLDILSLRVGSNAGMMTAGAGFHVAGLDCDYTFEDNPIETVHRFGLGIGFGRTVEEARQADLTAQEASLRRRLALAFARESTRRVEGLLTRTREALDDGQYDEALQQVASARVLDPEHSELNRLEASAHYHRALEMEKADDLSGAQIALERALILEPDNPAAATQLAKVKARAGNLAARSQKLRGIFDEALAAYAQNDLLTARDRLRYLLKLDPQDDEAAALLRPTVQALSQRAAAGMDQAAAHIRAGNWQAATNALNQARTLGADGVALARLEQQLQDARQEQERQMAQAERSAKSPVHAPSAKVAPVHASPLKVAPLKASFAGLSRAGQIEIEDLYRRGMEAIQDNRHQDAIRYWEIVWDRAPDYQNVAENLKQQYLATGMEDFAVGQLEQSIQTWEKALTIDPDDPRTQGYLARAYAHRSRIKQIKGN